MKVHYHPLSADTPITESTWLRLLRLCPKFSRWKVLSVTIVSLAAFVIFYCYFFTYTSPKEFKVSGSTGVDSVELFSSEAPTSHQSEFTEEDTSLNRIRYKHTNRRLPHAIIIGARKAGTRALLTFLNKHPDIMAAGDEVHFFDREENYSLGLDWYRKKMPFSFPDQLTIEKTPAYLCEEGVPELIHKMNSSIKLLLIVRDPVVRAISDYYQLFLKSTNRGKHAASFEEEVLNRDGSIDTEYTVLQRSIYSKHLKRWLKYFGERQIHLVDGDAFIRDNPAKELMKIETFLGIHHEFLEESFHFNRTKGFYCFGQGTENRCLGADKGRKHPHIDDAVIRKLRRFYQKYNERFFKMTGQDFGWNDALDADSEEE